MVSETLLEKGNALDRLQDIMERRKRHRKDYIASFLPVAENMHKVMREWLETEVEDLREELHILASVFGPERTATWARQLDEITSTFRERLASLGKAIEEARKGALTSLEEAERELGLAAAILDVLEASSKLQKLVEEVEAECRRVLDIRELIKIELAKLRG